MLSLVFQHFNIILGDWLTDDHCESMLSFWFYLDLGLTYSTRALERRCYQGGPLWPPPWFFGFGATKSPKLNLGAFLGLKTTWEAILNIFRSLCLVARGRQISIDIIVEKFKIFKILSFKGVMHLKWKLRTCTIQIELEKVGFISKKTKNFKIFRFSPNARGPPKIFDVNFFQFFEKQTPKLAFWDLANMERNKVRKFG